MFSSIKHGRNHISCQTKHNPTFSKVVQEMWDFKLVNVKLQKLPLNVLKYPQT